MIKNMVPEALQYVLILEQGAEVAQNQAINAHISLRVSTVEFKNEYFNMHFLHFVEKN